MSASACFSKAERVSAPAAALPPLLLGWSMLNTFFSLLAIKAQSSLLTLFRLLEKQPGGQIGEWDSERIGE